GQNYNNGFNEGGRQEIGDRRRSIGDRRRSIGDYFYLFSPPPLPPRCRGGWGGHTPHPTPHTLQLPTDN
ncbi:MAG: hypothetical protein ACKO2T_03095, partial [Microcystis aeruginosa]